MYGVPKDLEKHLPIGETLIQLLIGEFQIQFQFDEHNISVEGMWRLNDIDDNPIDSNKRDNKNVETHLPVLLGKKAISCFVHAPQSFTLVFEKGYRLTIYDDSQQYESFSIQPGDIFV